MQEFDVLVIGGGPGGYVAAIRAAQRGLSVGVVEKERTGGVCLNWGCIPTKAMLRSAEVYETVLHAADYGVQAENVSLDYDAVSRRKDGIVKGLTDGVASLLKANGVTVIYGHARFTGPTTLDVYAVGESALGAGGPKYAADPTGDQPVEQVKARDVIIATGSVPVQLPLPGADLPGVITSDGAFGLTEVPKRIAVIGGSAVGAEWASLFNTFGAEVTIIEMQPTLVPAEDAEIGKALGRSFGKAGINVLTGSTVSKIESAGRGKNAGLKVFVDGPKAQEIDADVVLVGVGRKPNTAALDLEKAGVATDARGFVPVDEQLRTNVEHVYAIGDVTGRVLLAHVASHQGVTAAEVIAGSDHARMDYDVIPAATFTHPEIASVGLTEAQAVEAGHEVVTGKFPFAAIGRTKTYGNSDGFMKIVAGKQYGEVLGVHIIGQSASDLITEGALAINLEATLDELAETVHAHPTLGEIGMEAAMSALGLPIHVAPPKKR
ncbi:dihydrolipoamide dehydrogenase [Saccharopolyspora erythraea NRRL 2338]|uniref:Dihydrolipoyl dehydrogenase n=3 Tax=Saccharopolyspora erythraea TaxID=1836 RepID=A4FLD8_SACEN|nr:dihydrolipoyl dehydrogenase [Saccharopolyspora erythraea]PFG98504.1 dihydrolipoamide dehydrogenase [Saccharopolyspora erythraea NRRL 2338]QRK88555.1 dihydrolipoyl dehydrogenase [Saccharopolyspora erythraea]CAM04863.1 dihydrolipoamide dehydrogenase [Saccharopolyspora erythraea NRRL 2338]